MGKNHIATADDFRQAQEAELESGTERVMLPKLRRAVLLRRPTPMWFLFHGQLPTSLAARVENGGPSGGPTIPSAEELRALAGWMAPLLEAVFVKPRLRLHPDADEISPDLLDLEDANYVIRWAVGEVQGSGVGGQGSGHSRQAGPLDSRPALSRGQAWRGNDQGSGDPGGEGLPEAGDLGTFRN